ncbi:uncharacterized protein TRAVEDRAFT_77800, partial [Trametes versicolor FP-101664 SS1]
IPRRLQFVTFHADLPFPKPQYLRIRTTRCCVAHRSRAAGYVDRALLGMDETQLLVNDGAS